MFWVIFILLLVIGWLTHHCFGLSCIVTDYERIFDDALDQDAVNQKLNNQTIDALLHEAENNSKG